MPASEVTHGDDGLRRRAAGQAIRELAHAMVGRRADTTLQDEVRSTLESLTARLRSFPPRMRPFEEYVTRTVEAPGGGGTIASFDDRPFSGPASPWGLDSDIRVLDGTIELDVTMRAAHEGGPGRAHGGIVAGMFDDLFGMVRSTLDGVGVTGELTVRYLLPTPLQHRLRCRAWPDRRDGRKQWITGELIDLTAEDQPVLARATGLFITVAAGTSALMTPERLAAVRSSIER